MKENEEAKCTVHVSLPEETNLRATGARQLSFEPGLRAGLQVPVDEKGQHSKDTRELNQMVGTMWEYTQHAADVLQLEHVRTLRRRVECAVALTSEELKHYKDPDELEGMNKSLWSQTFVHEFLREHGSAPFVKPQ